MATLFPVYFSFLSVTHFKVPFKIAKLLNMGFGDLKTKAGLKALDEFLADNSYIEGYAFYNNYD